jgi:hypothetical protein
MFLDILAGCLAYRTMVWPTIQSVYGVIIYIL